MILPKDPVINPIQSTTAAKDSGSEQQQARQSQQQAASGSKSAPAKNDAPSQPTQSPQQQSMHLGDRISGKWDQYVGQAKVSWGKLTDDELMKTEGNAQKLAGLVEERYAISREKAEEQVNKFLDDCDRK